MGSSLTSLHLNARRRLYHTKLVMKVLIICVCVVALAYAKPQTANFSGSHSGSASHGGSVVGAQKNEAGSNPTNTYQAGSNPSIPTYMPGAKHYDISGNNSGSVGDHSGGSKSNGAHSSATGGGGAGGQ